ncbi:uncharacterized protein K452DRAFT_317371 [Aplosporella prunicola CBS 121167]|uniref:Uncharacterized protein n=1 Tax=Aplosporella prunicola CBS 121167 TaxID=1176127 RepID=A0A6A6BK01_9PEZI|nr:uncharacterized protein K452DRAFT_317371 [Aplosporella prunicola CBS 121167]KAF2143147.1 hypothetical protein K452DRAFT_317371 [Aplosporella prunicola CBS 121167]
MPPKAKAKQHGQQKGSSLARTGPVASSSSSSSASTSTIRRNVAKLSDEDFAKTVLAPRGIHVLTPFFSSRAKPTTPTSHFHVPSLPKEGKVAFYRDLLGARNINVWVDGGAAFENNITAAYGAVWI